MGTAQRHALPREREIFAKAETVYGTKVAPVSGDAFRVMSANLGSAAQDRTNRTDNRPTRSVEERYVGKYQMADWSVEKFLIPSGTAGTPPDDVLLLTAAMGKYTNTPATSDVFELGTDQGEHGSLTLTDNKSGVKLEELAGAFVETLGIKGASGDPPMITYSGKGARKYYTGYNIVNGIAGADLTVDSLYTIEVGSRVAFYEAADGKTVVDDNSGAGFEVLSIAGSVATLDASPTGVVPTDIVRPFTPTPSTSGQVLPGVVGSVTLDDGSPISLPVTEWELTLANGFLAVEDESFQQYATDYYEGGDRMVTGQFKVRGRRDQFSWLGYRRDRVQLDATIVVGSTAGKIVTIEMPSCEIDFSPLEHPEAEASSIILPFVALGTDDELKISFT